MRRIAAAVAVLVVIGGVVAAVTAASRSGPVRPGPRPAIGSVGRLPAPSSSHVVVIAMENHSFDQVIGNPEAPYVNRLARRSALATRLYAIRHPSLPNYLALTGGSTFGVTSDCTDCAVHATNVVDQLERAHRSWKAYMEDLPHPCFEGASSGGYVKRHDPFLYYRDVATSAARCRRVVPLTQLAQDLRAGRLPAFAWITPNLCDDMHDCGVRAGDRFLAGLAPALLRELGPRGMLVVTWDEGPESDRAGCCRHAHGGRIPTIVAGPTVRAGARVAVRTDLYGVLRTIEDALGLPPLRAAACPCSRPLDAAFTRPPRAR